MLANAAGVGGGGVIVPIMMLFGFATKVCIALSNVIILIGAITRYVMNFNDSHPEKKATTIDYGIVILMMPTIMIGSFIGIQINLIAPKAIILGLLGALLSFVSYKTTQQGLKLFREESKAKTESPKDQPIVDQEVPSEHDEVVELQNVEPNMPLINSVTINSVTINSNDSFSTIALK